MEEPGDGSGTLATRRRPVAATILAVLTALAGCGGTASVDRTPYDVPERTTVAGGDLPPGVSASSLEEPLTVAKAHETTLEGRSYTVRRNRSLVAGDGAVLSARRVDLRVWKERDKFTAVSERRDGDRVVRVEYYADGTRVLRARGEGGRDPTAFSTVERRDDEAVTPDDVLVGDPPYRGTLYRYLAAAGDASVRRVSGRGVAEGTATYRIATRSFADADLLHPGVAGTVEEASLSVTLTDRGLVTAVAVRATLRHDGETFELTDTLRVSNVDETLVWAPGWVERARRVLE